MEKDPYSSNPEESEYDKKRRVLEKAVEDDRPKMIDFIGKRYYTQEYIDEANNRLAMKLAGEGDDADEDAKLAEWVFTYALGHEETLPGCRAMLASEYDDHLNDTDIVCTLTDEKDRHVFGIDISTATSSRAVLDKFKKGDHPTGAAPSGCKYIKFYKDNDYVACLNGVPRFILGASPLFIGHQKYLDNFQVTDEGLVSHAPDKDLKSNILMSLFLQSSAIKRNLMENPDGNEKTRERAINTCSAVREASREELKRLLGTEDKTEFAKKFNEELARIRSLRVNNYVDACFTTVINESVRRFNER